MQDVVMSAFWVGVYQNVIASLVIAAAAWLALIAALISFNVLRRRGQFRFFGLTKAAPRLTCYTSTVNVRPLGSAGPGGMPASFSGLAVPSYEMDALVPFVVLWDSGKLDRLPSGLRERLQKWWIIRNVRPEILPSPKSARTLVHGGSIVSVGSRAYNSCTAYLHDVLHTELSTSDGLAVLRATPKRLEWRCAEPQGADEETDFAIVERCSVPQTNTTYFVVAGLTKTGTAGAVAFLAKFWKDLYQVYGVRDFAICLKFNNISNDPIAHLKPDVVYWTPWRRIRRVVDHRRRASLGRMRVPPSQGSGDAGCTRPGLK
jgi:hypothetical protein